MSNFYGRMMNIKLSEGARSVFDTLAQGHKEARYAAAEIALEADAQIEALTAERDALRKLGLELIAAEDAFDGGGRPVRPCFEGINRCGQH